ncbi:glycosyltransferase involved in cell wall biosynthesis [Povalibacter uvarum]|uniref:Glycosyltransferase involved in cell wall biosynthesis n=1 Tax=Povalibacter uvarum TaxID=732238 RepID=A0A841HKX3_9GAMM|nr:glycosyltransferase family 4 protein [Povalibacter uvarum]MBB6093851.1 glycosyltransferase involved in cell wall biosynthesis [Povalibacter uvarum]
MTALRRLAFIGNSLPRRCGIATFTTDLQQAVANARPEVDVAIVAMTDHGRVYDYPSVVRMQINDDRQTEYEEAADFLNAGQFDIVCVQHEFGIFGGEAGGHLLALLSRLTMPIVTTLHTVLAEPRPAQRAVMKRLVDLSAKIVVMAEKARELLRNVYDVAAEKIEVIPHGIPDAAFVEPDAAKARLGFDGRTVMLTFGLLSPNKGIEVMIDAMPAILRSRPDAVYVVLGATHPNLVHSEGEAYRERLQARVHALGLEKQVVFLNRFVDQPTLLDFISMCDVYVTPYLNEAQMTSGTLAYSFGLGKAVVSTPYWHARELLADGRGILVPFGDAAAIGAEIARLLCNDNRRQAMRTEAYANSRSMTWKRTAERYFATFDRIRRLQRLKVIASPGEGTVQESPPLPAMQLGYFFSMCDDTGLFQHAIHSVPDRSHGYCVDDNARALLVACALNTGGEHRMPDALTTRIAAFVQHAWNADTRRFRNFMSFERRWLEDSGSEDSNGRTLWALGECSRDDSSATRRQWAVALFAEALPSAESFHSPRAWAFTLLGLDAYCTVAPQDSRAPSMRRLLADRLMSVLASVETEDWVWFEEVLAYDNARLSQALIVTGLAAGVPAYAAAGRRSLRWLMALQRSVAGHFRPVGSGSFGDKRRLPRSFDQQPLEAAAAISACLAAWRADGDPQWASDAQRAFAWFLGSNDLSTPLVDTETGSCRDGLHADRANENRGGESAVSYLMGLAEMREFARLVSNRPKPARLRMLRA